jgi:hypothetical protein
MEGVKRIKDLDLSIFCTQGTVGVGVCIPTFTVSFLRAGSHQIIVDGFVRAILSSYP